MEYKTLLEAWGLVSTIPNFENEGIDDESFKLLDDFTIDQIFSKIGPKLIFKKNYRQYLMGQYKSLNDTTDSASNLDSVSDTTSIDVILEPDSELANILNERLHEEANNFKVPIPPSFTNISDEAREVPSTFYADPFPNKRVKKGTIFSDSLENILNSSPDGKLVLMNKRKLNNDLRQKLCKIIITDLLKSNGEKSDMKAEKFSAAAEEITSLFPGEIKETYFMPYSSPKTGLRRPARGKLWSRYVNVKAALRIANQNILSESHKSECFSESIHEINENIESELTFLKSATEPYSRVLSAWESTFNVRRQRYSDCGIEQILDAFPCLKLNYGAELLESDFNQMFADKIDTVYSEWPKISGAIIKEVKERKIQLNFETDLDHSTKALLLLPYLFTPVTLKSNLKNKSNWRPTRCEVQESFIFRTKNLDDVAEIIDRRKAKLDNYNLPLQPFAVVNGETNDINFHIIFNEHKYKCVSGIRCLELLFKIFHALNLEYPSECKHIWHFIQDMVFQMPATSKTSSTVCVIADIKFHLK